MPRSRPLPVGLKDPDETLPETLTPPLAQRVIAWQRRAGRHDLPWQRTRDPYAVWLSEIMLQQTQVATVIPYYERFLQVFPDVAALASAPQDEVLRLWSGLGYYSRARNLHRCAIQVVTCHGGRFPSSAQALAELPGIGRSTAAAIAAFCFGERAAILDGNVKRVFCRIFGVEGWPGAPAVERVLWRIALRELPLAGVDAWTQGLMDLGATLCTRSKPRCGDCPVADACRARGERRVHQLPTPRPRREVPWREARLWILRRADVVLLEKRPPAGIWGGLWSLPQTTMDAPADAPPAYLGLKGPVPIALSAFDHAFTHFRLRVHPMLVDLPAVAANASATDMPPVSDARAGAREVVQPASLRWLALADVAEAGLPRPVKTLLLSLGAGQPDGSTLVSKK